MSTKVNEVPKSVAETLEKISELAASLQKTDDAVQIMRSQDLSALAYQLTSTESAKLDVALAFTLASLCFTKMNLHGADTANHPIQDDLARIRALVSKVNNIEKKKSSEEENPAKRLKLDSAAANRMIASSLN